MKLFVLARYDRLGASSRLRSMQFLPWLKRAGITCEVQALFSDEMLHTKYRTGRYGLLLTVDAYARRIWQLIHRHKFDLIYIEKEALPWLPVQIEKALLSGVPYALDFDDAVFHNYDLNHSAWARRLLGRRLDDLMSGARLVTVGNDYLGRRARDAGAPWVELVPTVIDLDRYSVEPRAPEPDGVPRIVWIGSPSTIKYLADLGPALASLAQRRAFTLRVIGGELQMPGVDVECVEWSEDSEVRSISDCDVGIMPLTDSPWERGKCGYKLIQYMACSLPVVASPVGVNVQIVEEGVNGFLAGDSDTWITRLEQLLSDPAMRGNMGSIGRRKVETDYCVQRVAPRLISLLRKAGTT